MNEERRTFVLIEKLVGQKKRNCKARQEKLDRRQQKGIRERT